MFSNNCFTWNLSSKFLRWHRLKRIKTTNISGLLHWLERRKKKNSFQEKREKKTSAGRLRAGRWGDPEVGKSSSKPDEALEGLMQRDRLLFTACGSVRKTTNSSSSPLNHTRSETHVHDLMNQPITSVYKLVKAVRSALPRLLAGICASKQWTHVSAADVLQLQTCSRNLFSKDATLPRRRWAAL